MTTKGIERAYISSPQTTLALDCFFNIPPFSVFPFPFFFQFLSLIQNETAFTSRPIVCDSMKRMCLPLILRRKAFSEYDAGILLIPFEATRSLFQPILSHSVPFLRAELLVQY